MTNVAAQHLKEADLCAAFIESLNKVPGWLCYPEAAGFDVLALHESGRQIGVEAKLTLNAKVADQILPKDYETFYGRPGPDHRMVIVPKLTDASYGISRLLHMVGIPVLVPSHRYRNANTWGWEFDLKFDCNLGTGWHHYTSSERLHLFDWNPPIRCRVPMAVGTHQAGVPSPVSLTPWKEAALKVIALLRKQGFVTTKHIQEHGISPTAWTRPNGSKPSWLARGAIRGTWVESEHLPPFDKQHPEAYAMVVAALQTPAPANQPLELRA